MQSPKYEYWHDAYMINGVALTTLKKLVAAGKLAKTEVEEMVADRLEKYGY